MKQSFCALKKNGGAIRFYRRHRVHETDKRELVEGEGRKFERNFQTTY